MKKNFSKTRFGLVYTLFVTLPFLSVYAQETAPTPTDTTGYRAELIQDIEMLSTRYLNLLSAMEGKYEWRPGEGVRSTSEVFMHVANANSMIPSLVGMELPESIRGADMGETRAKMQEREKMTDPVSMRAALEESFDFAKQVISNVPDNELDASVSMFGRPATKRQVLNLAVNHMHEHLGQLIAYARMNNVTPPWSE